MAYVQNSPSCDPLQRKTLDNIKNEKKKTCLLSNYSSSPGAYGMYDQAAF